jgi:glycine/D-amino acid oxidase-like deaminating enzyme
MLPIEQSCYWMTTAPYRTHPFLSGDAQTEFAIIGAGFTGLWTAIFLRELAPNAPITIVDQQWAGFGASGRNAGMMDVTMDHSHALAISHFGFSEAKKMATIGKQNVDEILEFLETNHIQCQQQQTGRFFVALTQAQIEEGKHSLEVAAKLGISDRRWLNAEEIQNEVRSSLYLGAVFAPGAVILNPFQLVQGLKQYLLQRKVSFFEQTKVREIGSTIRADSGTLSAKKIIVATDAFTHHLFPKLLSRFIPLYDYILVSDPLTPQQQDAIGWRGRQGITDGRTFFNYYRLTADQRILFGTSEAMYYRGNRVDPGCDHSESHYKSLHESFVRHFPQLRDLNFPYAWGGAIASTTRLTPFFGKLDRGRILYALGYTGHGLGTTRLAGKILAHMALEKRTDLFDLAMVRKQPFPYPPEPFRSIAVKAVTKSLRKVDLGKQPDLLLQLLDYFKIGFSS